MKHTILLALAAFALSSCTSPFGQSTDQMRIAMGQAMLQMPALQQQASLAMAGRQFNTLAPSAAPSRTNTLRLAPLAPLTPLQPLR